MLNRRFAIGTLAVTLALLIAVAGVWYTQRTDAQETPTTESNQWLDSRAQNQIPMSNASAQIHRLWQTAGYQDFVGVSFDNDRWEVVLYWKGEQLPPGMEALVAELRTTVPIRVVNAPYSLEELQAESKRLIQLGATAGVMVNEAGPTADFSAIRIGVDTEDSRSDAEKIELARQVIRSDFPLEFKIAASPKPFSSAY